MQDQLNAFESLISSPRFSTYLKMAHNDKRLAFELYRWNTEVSSALVWSMHFAELAVRNGVNTYFKSLYGDGWTDALPFRGALEQRDAETLRRTFDRQAKARRPEAPTDDQIVADLSFGFWVSIFRRRYGVPFGWNTGIGKVFPDAVPQLELGEIQRRLDMIRAMRNRVAHHEPVVHRGIAHAMSVRNLALDVVSWSNHTAAEFLGLNDPLPATLARDPRDRTRRV
jgi:hypothetical protein